MNKSILVTGGNGYIGSHTLISLCEASYTPIVIDNLSNSSRDSVKKVEDITGKSIKFYDVDLRSIRDLIKIFGENNTDTDIIDAVIHFAGFKAVGESVDNPLTYYHNNINGTITLLRVMKLFEIKKLIFSSSATVYGVPDVVPIKEDSKKSVTNPYGRTKLMVEEICHDIVNSKDGWRIVLLRYFNPIGAHPSGLIGENLSGVANNLMPYILNVALGSENELKIFGGDYNTEDGTGKRDYVHVMDIADGHVSALNWLSNQSEENICESFNLGTGKSISVLELVEEFKRQTNIDIKYSIVDRRAGDIDESYADVEKSKRILKWEAKRSLVDMVKDGWKSAKVDNNLS